MTVERLADEWWSTHAPELSPSTRIGYRYWLDHRLLTQSVRRIYAAVPKIRARSVDEFAGANVVSACAASKWILALDDALPEDAQFKCP
jgi:hypothetical protein